MDNERVTFVVEFPEGRHCPPISAGMEIYGGSVVAVSFSDALKELEELEESADG
jgi:hypothetical protein